jgi:hypothetical protein
VYLLGWMGSLSRGGRALTRSSRRYYTSLRFKILYWSSRNRWLIDLHIISPRLLSTRRLRSCVNVHWVFSLGSVHSVPRFFDPTSAGSFHGHLRQILSIMMVRTGPHRGFIILRKCHFRYEIRKCLEDSLTLHAALAEVIGEIETRWENDIFFESNGQVSPLNKAIL